MGSDNSFEGERLLSSLSENCAFYGLTKRSSPPSLLDAVLLTKKCFNCEKTGHLARNCFKKRRKQNGKGSATFFKCWKAGHIARSCKSMKNDNPVSRNSIHPALAANDTKTKSGSGILDSGCTRHMCNHKWCFQLSPNAVRRFRSERMK